MSPARRKAALLAITQRHSNTLSVTAVSEAAWQAGVRPGMTLASARAIVPDLEAAPQNEAEELAALHSVAQVAYGFSPRIGVLRPDALLVDATGCDRLHGGEQALASKLAAAVEGIGYTASIAMADHSGVALAMARSKRDPVQVQPPGSGTAGLEDLPLGILGLEDEALAAQLRTLGIASAGQLLNLPRGALPARFGEELTRVVRCLRGEEQVQTDRWAPPVTIGDRLDFAGPTDRNDALVEAIRQLCAFITLRLEAAACAATRLQVTLFAAEGPPVEFEVSLAAPRADARSLRTVLLARFEGIDTGERWYEGVALTVTSTETTGAVQQHLFERVADNWSAGVNSTLDEVVGKLGAEAVMRAELTTHPEPLRAFRWVRWGRKAAKAAPSTCAPGALPARLNPAAYHTVPAARPLPAWWDFQSCAGRLRVIGGNLRFEFDARRDYLLLEDATAARHLVWRDAAGWHVPKCLATRASELDALDACGRDAAPQSAMYAELACATHFSFLRGASGPAEMVERAFELGLNALAITDVHSLAGIVRAHARAKELGMKILVGTRLSLRDGPDLCLYAMNRAGYVNLCRLLTQGKLRTGKGDCELYMADLPTRAAGLQAVLMNGHALTPGLLSELSSIFDPCLSLAIARHFEPGDTARNRAVAGLAAKAGIALVAVNDACAATGQDRLLQAVVTCIRHGTTLEEGAGHVAVNGERHLKAPGQMAELLHEYPAAIARSVEIADSCSFSMDELAYEYPDEVVPPGMDMQEYLEQQTWQGAARRYPAGIPAKVRAQLERELELIGELRYAAYFLTIHDIVQEAQRREILCQGRGSAANSAVCYCLGITAVPPGQGALLFERFISRERNEPPDIDVDFEHERREEIIQYIYGKYGRHRAGICSTVITYRFRSAMRDVGKVLGFSLDQLGRMSRSSAWWDNTDRVARTLKESGVHAGDARGRMLVDLVARLQGAPRHLSQHVGGFVITRSRLDELVPIENAAMKDRTFIEWNKDDIDALRILKVDCLALGMLTAIKKAFLLIAGAGGTRLTRHTVMACDPALDGKTPHARAIYGMLQKADAVGTFQVESRAQMSMLPRLKPACFYDLVIEVAIVRPGPIQGGMVHPYLRRREGTEAVDYIYPKLEDVLRQTLGVPLFQEQAMQIAMVAAGYSAGEADQLRRAMGSWRNDGRIAEHRRRLLEGMCARGISMQDADRVFKQIQGFASYGFPEAHAASFALITFVSAYLKRFYPAAFTAALLNSQPMGFYSASSLVRDAREHGVTVLPPCINASSFDCSLEGGSGCAPAPLQAHPAVWGTTGPSLRLGLRQVRGLGEDAANAIANERAQRGRFEDLRDFIARVGERGLPNHQRYRALVQLASADAFAGLGMSRRDVLWEVAALRHRAPRLFAESLEPTPAALPPMSAFEHMLADYEMLELSLRAHPMEFIRQGERARGTVTCAEMRLLPHGRKVEVAGRIINRQHPSTAKGITFMTLEDETDVANVIVKPDVFERFRKIALGTDMAAIKGKVERTGDVVHVVAESFRSLASAFRGLNVSSRNFH